jgi:hypothetical protein
MDPKQQYIGVGLIDDVRQDVRDTGRLREGRTDRAWFNQYKDDPQEEVRRLIQAAYQSAQTPT